MKSDRTWILLANYEDRSLVRGKVAWDLGKQLAGLKWTPDSAFTELFLNGKYLGSYKLVQSIKIDSNRVNVNKVTGQVMEWDPHWKDGDGTYGFTSWSGQDNWFKDPDTYDSLSTGEPDPEGLSDARRSMLKDKVNHFEHVLYGDDKKRDWSNTTYTPGGVDDWTTYLDMDSAVDYYLSKEFTKDQDADMYRSNFYYTDNVDPNSSAKIFMGPIWGLRSQRWCGDRWHHVDRLDVRLVDARATVRRRTTPTRSTGTPGSSRTLDSSTRSRRAGRRPSRCTRPSAPPRSTRQSPRSAVRRRWASRWLRTISRCGARVVSRYTFHASTYPGEITWLKNWYTARYNWMDSQLKWGAVSNRGCSCFPDHLSSPQGSPDRGGPCGCGAAVRGRLVFTPRSALAW